MAKNYQVENIGVNIVSTVEQSLQALSQLKAKIAETNAQLKDTNTKVSQIKLSVSSSGGVSTSTVIKNMATETNKLATNSERASRGFAKAGTAIAGMVSLRFAIVQFTKAFTEMSNFAENYNLFTVAMKGYKNEAIAFHNEMNRAWGTNISQTMRYQGFFQNLVTSLGIAEDKAFSVSQSLTTLTLDMASLFNWEFDVAYQRLQAGIVGQTKPLRYAGIDVTQQTIQPILGELGIEKQVVQLSQAEKVMLRYIAVLRQSSNAHGDFARTLESPANQMRIMQTTIQELYRWFGGLFIGLVGNALPYINGFLMAIKEVVKALAIMLGFNQDDYDFYNGSGMEDGLGGLEDDANSANTAIGKLTGSLRKFDEINNISMSRSGGSVSGISGVDNRLWEELQNQMNKYKSGLGTIQSEATKIRDTIFKWIGIHAEVNDETKELEITFTTWGKTLVTVGAIILGAKGVGAIANLFKALGTIQTALTGGKVLAGGTTVAGASALGGIIGSLALFGVLVGTVFVGVKAFEWLDQFKTKLDNPLAKLTKLEELLINIGVLFGVVDPKMRDIRLDGADVFTGADGGTGRRTPNPAQLDFDLYNRFFGNLPIRDTLPTRQPAPSAPTTITVQMADGTKLGSAIIDLVNNTQATTGKTVVAY